MKKKIVGIFVMMLLIVGAFPIINSSEIQNTTFDDLDAFIIDAMNTYHIPGLSSSILINENILWTGSYGFADIEQNIYVNDSTLFVLASISKTIAATAIMQLCNQGFFDLDEPINDYLPFQVIYPTYPSVDLTFHMLLTHTSGIKDNWAIIPIYEGDSPNPLGTWLEDCLTSNGQYYDADKQFNNWRPGDSWEYCNTGTALLGYLVEVISDVPFDEYCRINIFEPLEMDKTAWFLADLDINNIAVPYSWISKGYYLPYYHMGIDPYPAASLRTSASQLNNFLLMYMNYGEYNSEVILDRDTVENILTTQVPFVPHTITYLEEAEQGIQWLKCSINGRILWGHPGSGEGCRTQMWFDPEKNIGAIILTNGEPDQSNLFEITEKLFDFADEQITNNIPPNTPEINGLTSGENGTEYEYTFVATDPNEDDISYCIDWGDDSGEETIGPFPSGEEQTSSHTWSDEGTYIIKVKVKDFYGAESEWAELEISMPKTKTTNSPFLTFLQNHPRLFPLLRQILGL